MSFEDELTALVGDNLIDFLLKDDIPCPEIPGVENNLEDFSLTEAEILDMDDFITSALDSLEEEQDALQNYLLSEYQHLSPSPGSNFAGSPWDSDSVQSDHNYSLPLDMSVMESMRSDMAEGGTSIELEKWMDLEGTSMELEQSSSFPTDVAMDAGPQLVSGAIVQDEVHLMNELHERQSALDDYHRETDGCSLENRPLLEQFEVLQTTASQSTTVIVTEKPSDVVMVFSVNFTLSSSFSLLQGREIETEVRVLSEQTFELTNQVAPDVQENTALEQSSPEPEDPFLFDNLSQSQEE